MRRQFIKGLTILGALTFLWLVVVVGALIYVAASKRSVPRHTIVELDLQKNLLEEMPDGPLARLNSRGSLRVRDVVFALEKRPPTRTFWRCLPASGPTPGVLRKRRRSRRGSGFPQIGQTRNRLCGNPRRRRVERTASTTWRQGSTKSGCSHPGGRPAGPGVTTPFIRGTLDKLGIVPRFDGRKEYKNAINELTEKAYTPAHREATLKLINSIADQLVQGIAAAQNAPKSRYASSSRTDRIWRKRRKRPAWSRAWPIATTWSPN